MFKSSIQAVKGLLSRLDAVFDEILQYAVLARQAVPWLRG